MSTISVKHLIWIILALNIYGCMPGYRWVNPSYSEAEMRDQFILDKGECMQRAGMSYPDPAPVPNPDELYYECMSETNRVERYPVRTDDGEIEYRTVVRRGNPYYCRPPRELRRAYREYESILRQQQLSRARLVNSCLAMFGWDREKKEEAPEAKVP